MIKTKILAVLKNDIFWIFFISGLAGLFGKLANVYDSQVLSNIGVFFTCAAVVYFFYWVLYKYVNN